MEIKVNLSGQQLWDPEVRDAYVRLTGEELPLGRLTVGQSVRARAHDLFEAGALVMVDPKGDLHWVAADGSPRWSDAEGLADFPAGYRFAPIAPYSDTYCILAVRDVPKADAVWPMGKEVQPNTRMIDLFEDGVREIESIEGGCQKMFKQGDGPIQVQVFAADGSPMGRPYSAGRTETVVWPLTKVVRRAD